MNHIFWIHPADGVVFPSSCVSHVDANEFASIIFGGFSIEVVT